MSFRREVSDWTFRTAAVRSRFVRGRSTLYILAGHSGMRVHVGCSGWFYSHWRGIFYPRQELTTKNWFAYYANVFDTVELNAPFYRWPKPATVRRWKRDAPPRFIYTVKVNQLITHERRMVRTRKLIQDYYGIEDVLAEKMGCFLFQFPPSHRYTPARLKSIIAQLDPAHRNAVEFRHRSWWRDAVYRAFARRGITFVAVSAPRLPETFPPNQRMLYVRFSGKTRWYIHDYSREELDMWAARIRASGAEEVWIYFNNDRNGFAIKNALHLRRLLRAGREGPAEEMPARQVAQVKSGTAPSPAGS